jgi:restriction endonuclease S subunit
MAQVVAREKIAESGDYNLTGERYREVETFTNQKWPMVELGEVVEIQNGLWKGKKPPFVKAKVLRNTNFIKKTGALSFDDVAEIDVEKRHFEKRELINGDIILENSGGSPTQPVGRVAYFGKNLKGFSYSNFTSRIRVLDKNICDSKYLWAILLNFYKSGKTEVLQSQTSGIKNLNKKGYLKLKIPLPPLSVQKEIVEKIEVKQKAIDSAKEVIRNLERERRYFGESLRRIEGIEWVELGEVCEFVRGPFGGSLKKEIFVTEGFAVFEQQHAIYGNFTNFRYFITPDKFEEMKRFEVKPNDLIMSCSGTIGKTVIIPKNAPRGIINQALLKLKVTEKLDVRYLKYWMDGKYFQKSVFENVEGVAIKNVASVKVLSSIKIPLPSLEIQQKMIAETEEEQKIIDANKRLIEIMEGKIEKVLEEI